MTYRFPPPDEEDLNLKYKFGDDIKYRIAFEKTPLIAYDYIDIEKTNYHFHQKCLNNYDAKNYFLKLKEISSKNIDELKINYKDHFHIYNDPPKKLKSLFKELFNKTNIRAEEIPPFGQIALYTDKKGADRTKNIKSPRIYFIIGRYAVFHILFYDPYHEINPAN